MGFFLREEQKTSGKMVKLTADVILEAAQSVNACRERELNLRGYKFAQLENLGATLDQYDAINMNDNDLKKIENFPYFQRLKVLYLANNRIRKIATDFVTNVPNLEELVLNNNELKELMDVDILAGLEKLEYLSLLGCPMTAITDYRRVKESGRKEAKKVFGGKAGKAILKQMANTFTPGEGLQDQINSRNKGGLSEQEKAKIKEAILAASSLEEVERLQQQLQAGYIPGQEKKKAANEDEEEEDEEMEE